MVHASRLKFFGDSNLEVTEELREHVAAQGIVLKVEAIREHRWNSDMQDYERWEGLEAIEDCWEPFKAMRRDVEVLVSTYVLKAKDNKLTTYHNSSAT
ncbi:hypothetical protein PC129_g1101 [Phytophthora cactorum]|uniref:Chromo domain-containing protein n=1 Tax=Phytophthora cactorum TaxID=29920 RepID=A0A8T1IV20_9STRA|nr:hypothetical protein PC129_g1101 [Phytophthora cactorum]